MSSFFDFFDDAWEWLDSKLTVLWGAIGPAFSAAILGIIKDGGPMLIAAAGAAALSAETSNAKGIDKLKVAAEQVMNDMKDKIPGLVLTNAVNAVQIAVTNMQNGLKPDGNELDAGQAPLLPPPGASQPAPDTPAS